MTQLTECQLALTLFNLLKSWKVPARKETKGLPMVLFELLDALVERRIVQGVLQVELRAGDPEHFLCTAEHVHLICAQAKKVKVRTRFI